MSTKYYECLKKRLQNITGITKNSIFLGAFPWERTFIFNIVKIKYLIFLIVAGFIFACNRKPADLFVETESFVEKGGWVVDQQFMSGKEQHPTTSITWAGH